MKKSVLTILLLIPLTLLIPAIGFAGEPPPEGSSPVLPAYMGNLTVEWQPTGSTCDSNFAWPGGPFPCGNVIIYGKLDCAEKRCDDIKIPKKNPIYYPLSLAQVDFLSLEAADLPLRTTYYAWGLPLAGPNTYFAIMSADNLSYQSETLFTVDVVLMQFK